MVEEQFGRGALSSRKKLRVGTLRPIRFSGLANHDY